MSELRTTQGAMEVISIASESAPVRMTQHSVEVISIAAEGADPIRMTQASLSVIQQGTFPPKAPELTATQVSGTSFALETGEFVAVEEGDTHASTTWQVTTAADTGFASATSVTSESALMFFLAEGLDPETAYIARALHTGDIGGNSPFSNVVEFTTTEAAPRPDTPVVTVDDQGTDFVTATRSAFAHAEGVGDGTSDEEGEVLPYEIAVQWQIREPSAAWEDAVIDTGLSPLYLDALTSTFDPLEPEIGYEIRVRVQDGKYGATSLWSTPAPFTTDAIPPIRPDTPTITITKCGREETTAEGSVFSHPETSLHTQSRWWIAGGTETAPGASDSIIVGEPELTQIVWPLLMAGPKWLAVAYQDAEGRWSERSAWALCMVPAEPPAPDLITPTPGVVISEDTLFDWEIPESEAGWVFEGQLRYEEGPFEPLFGPQTESEYLFSIEGRPNGQYMMRARACYPAADDCGEWVYWPVRIDRTGAVSVTYNFRTMAEIPEHMVPIWDPEGHVSWTLMNNGLGLLASNGTNLRDQMAVLAFTELGQPQTLDMYVTFQAVLNANVWHGWRTSQGSALNGGAAWNALDASDTMAEKSGFHHTTRPSGRGWPYAGDDCSGPPYPRIIAGCGVDWCSVAARSHPAHGILSRMFPTRALSFGVQHSRSNHRQYGYREQRTQHFTFGSENHQYKDDPTISPEPEEPRVRVRGIRSYMANTPCDFPVWWYTMRQRVTREANGFLRIRIYVMGPGLHPDQGAVIDRSFDPDAPLPSDPSWAFRDLPCGYCGLAFRQLPYLTNDPGVLFASATIVLPDGFILNGPALGAASLVEG